MARQRNGTHEIGQGPVRGKAGQWGRALAAATAALGMGLALIGPGCTPAEVEETAMPEASRVSQGDALMTSRAESAATLRPNAIATRTPEAWTEQPPTATYTLFPTPTPALPSADGGAVPQGAIARLGIGPIHAAALSPDGKYLAVGTTVGLYMYRADIFQRLWSKQSEYPVSLMAWSPDSRLIAVRMLRNGSISVLAGATGAQQAFIEQSTAIYSVAWSPDGTRLVVGWGGGYVYSQPSSISARITVWNIATVTQVFTAEAGGEGVDEVWGTWDVAWSPHSDLIAGTLIRFTNSGRQEGLVVLWDATTGAELRSMEHDWVSHLAFSPDGRMLATWSGDTDGDAPQGNPEARVWDVESGDLIHAMKGYKGDYNYAYAVAWSPDGSRLASGSLGDDHAETIIWDTATGEELQRIRANVTGATLALAWSPDGRWLASGTGSYPMPGEGPGEVTIWDSATNSVTEHWLDHGSNVFDLEWMPDSHTFISVSSELLALRDGTNGRPTLGLTASRLCATVGGLSFPSSEQLLTFIWHTCSSERLIMAWNITNKQPESIRSLSPEEDIGPLFPNPDPRSSDGRWEARAEVIGDPYDWDVTLRTRITVVDRVSGAALYDFEGPPAAELILNWSPDGTMLAAAGGLDDFRSMQGWEENAVMVWDITTGTLLHSFLGHTGRVYSLAWSADGTLLASGSADGTVIIWDVRR